MASSSSQQGTFFLALALTLATTVFVTASGQQQPAAGGEAPSPAPAGPLNLTEILTKATHYNTFVRLLKDTEVSSQVSSLLNNDRNADGLTVLAPTDAAFGRLRPGTLNRMDAQAQSELVLFHILPKYYGFVTFETTTNPVRTQASSQRGVCTVNITTAGEEKVNVSSGVMETTLGKPLRDGHPLAVYSLDDVLLPPDMFGPGAKKNLGADAPTAAGKPGKQTASSSSSTVAATPDEAPSKEADATATAAAGRIAIGWPVFAAAVTALAMSLL
ncbi:fasciclin-like arabinogalactan protein 13 [Oryza brachyantha]|uniref:FAS1 domain-containing protein n=1 Tax=Oryza brachyantha TaxID=4533 RepID=J3LC45_ORYBR|nr:fasciclin-like arabinogalactan protein 13 [Oryza brachyantha]